MELANLERYLWNHIIFFAIPAEFGYSPPVMQNRTPYNSFSPATPAGHSPHRAGRVLLPCLVAFLLLAHPLFGRDETHVVKRGDTLSDIAAKYRITVRQIMDWNELSGDTIMAGQRLSVQSPGEVDTYVVKSGDTLIEISSRFNISLASLRRLNDIHGDRIYPGQTLRLRGAGELAAHVVGKGETLWKISQRYGLSVSELKELNDLDSDAIAPGMTLRLMKPAEEETEEDSAESFEYVVQQGDNLWDIAERFNVGVNLLRQLNPLEGDRISPGQRLQVRPSSLDEAVHIVRAGDTLSDIALKYDTRISELREINGIKESRILVGQKLRLKKTPDAAYIVDRGDALWEIARAYRMSVDDLMQLNGLSSHRIYPGQELHLGRMPSDPYDTYTVKAGDYLGQIARLYQMSVADIKEANNLRNAVIHPGDVLKVNPLLGGGRKLSDTGDIDWQRLMTASSRTLIAAGNGPYYYTRPGADRQKHKAYFEKEAKLTPLKSYRQARKLWEDFEREVGKTGRLSNTLKGWYFVLDPGHGGLDPGAVVETVAGNGRKVYVVEDEYVYDIALRVYVLLRLHGAEAAMTLLSPNHLIRQSTPPTSTFVNEKNEVYNSYRLNKNNRWRDWPNGGSNGNLGNRVELAGEFFKNTPKNRRIFLSFHADISPNAPEALMALYYRSRNGRRVDTASKKFAAALLPSLGAGAHTRGQALGVLRNNPAALKLLLEMRNLAYSDHAWALRFEELRQRDAEKVVKALLDYVK